jgi:hypothetical protein
MTPPKTYMLVPHHDFPADALSLGSIILDPKQPGESLNPAEIVEIPHKYTSHKYNWEQTIDFTKDGQIGVWARCVNILWGLGGNIGASFDAAALERYRFDDLETTYFSPTQEYLEEAIGKRGVSSFLQGARYGPVYMITGLKIVRGPGAQVTSRRTLIAEGHANGGLPGMLGTRSYVLDTGDMSYRHASTTNTSFTGSSDFVIGYRLGKIAFDKNTDGFLTPEHQPYIKDAMMGVSDSRKVRCSAPDNAMKIIFDGEHGVAEELCEQNLDAIPAVDEDGSENCQCFILPTQGDRSFVIESH